MRSPCAATRASTFSGAATSFLAFGKCWHGGLSHFADTAPPAGKAHVYRGSPKADARIRTADPFITSEVLYQLSYVGGSRPV